MIATFRKSGGRWRGPLLAESGRLLKPRGILCTYGCFTRGGRHLTSGNAEFHWGLKHRSPDWGVRAVEEVETEARRHGLELAEAVDMPADNLMLVLTRW